MLILADSILFLCNSALGEETSTGHYVATVILYDGSCVTYDDDLVTRSAIVSETVWRTARLLAFEEMEATHGPARCGSASSYGPSLREDAETTNHSCNDHKHCSGHSTSEYEGCLTEGTSEDPAASAQAEPERSSALIPLLNGDARILLVLYTENNDCNAFSASLTHYVHDTDTPVGLDDCSSRLEHPVSTLCTQHINSSAALQTLP